MARCHQCFGFVKVRSLCLSLLDSFYMQPFEVLRVVRHRLVGVMRHAQQQ